MNFNDFTLQRNMIFDDFPGLFRYQFWHWFWKRFGIDFSSILASFCNYFHVFSTSVFESIFLLAFWWKWYQNWSGETYPEPSFFVSFFITLVPFTYAIPTSARKQFFQLFFTKIKEFIHTCTFYPRNTYKCAMAVFTILKKKFNEKNLMIFLIFGSLLSSFGSLLAPFECQTSSKILFLFDLVSPFADVWNHFCKKVNVGTLSARTRIVGTPICGNPSNRKLNEKNLYDFEWFSSLGSLWDEFLKLPWLNLVSFGTFYSFVVPLESFWFLEYQTFFNNDCFGLILDLSKTNTQSSAELCRRHLKARGPWPKVLWPVAEIMLARGQSYVGTWPKLC